MQYAIEIRFDQESESRIFELWQRAASFYRCDYLLQNNVIPHVALLVGDSKLPLLFEKLEIPSGLIRFSDFDFFDEGRISYLRVSPETDIFDYQRSTYLAARSLGAQIDFHYTPDIWIPHCTVAQDCKSNQNQIMKEFTLEARIRSLILVHFPPTSLLGERLPLEPNKTVEALRCAP